MLRMFPSLALFSFESIRQPVAPALPRSSADSITLGALSLGRSNRVRRSSEGQRSGFVSANHTARAPWCSQPAHPSPWHRLGVSSRISQGSKTFLVFTYCVIKFVQWSCPSAVSALSGHGRPSRLSRTSCRWHPQPQCVSKVTGLTSVHRPGTTNEKSH